MISSRILCLLALMFWCNMTKASDKAIRINTSNQGKLAEFQRFFDGYNIESTKVDLMEPKGTPEEVVRYKASQLEENVLIDDTSLEIPGEPDFGVNIKFELHRLADPNMIGKKATFVCLLGTKVGDKIRIYRGEVTGKIAAASGAGFGFDKFFVPDGSNLTLGQDKPDEKNARYHAVKVYLQDRYVEYDLLETWAGEFQKE